MLDSGLLILAFLSTVIARIRNFENFPEKIAKRKGCGQKDSYGGVLALKH